MWLGARAADSCSTSQAAVSKWALSLHKMDAQQLSNSRAAVGSGANFQGSQLQNHDSQSCHLRGEETQRGRRGVGRRLCEGHPCSQPLPRTRFWGIQSQACGWHPCVVNVGQSETKLGWCAGLWGPSGGQPTHSTVAKGRWETKKWEVPWRRIYVFFLGDRFSLQWLECSFNLTMDFLI